MKAPIAPIRSGDKVPTAAVKPLGKLHRSGGFGTDFSRSAQQPFVPAQHEAFDAHAFDHVEAAQGFVEKAVAARLVLFPVHLQFQNPAAGKPEDQEGEDQDEEDRVTGHR